MRSGALDASQDRGGIRLSLDHYVNDERQAKLTMMVLAVMAVISVALTVAAIFKA